MNDAFYMAFEDKYRGSRESIKSRLRIYLPFIEPLLSLHKNAAAIDLGCGRGEWLEILRETTFNSQGIDLNEDMLSICRDIGLKVQNRDAVLFLKELPDASQSVISGFHIAEHIPFSDLQALIQEALRVLRPAGLLILETPNPENIVVGSSTFYIDPTHNRPIPIQLLSFLPEYYGFEKVKVLRLQEPTRLSCIKSPSLLDVLLGVSPDYAVVAQKGAPEEQMKLFELEFEKEYGLSLEALTQTYTQTYEARIAKVEAKSELNELRLEQIRNSQLWRTLRWINNKIEGLKSRLN